MEIQLVGLPGNPTYYSAEALVEAAAAFGLARIGVEEETHLNPSLQGLPKFEEMAGPIGCTPSPEGAILIRYETWEANRLYSS